MNVSSRNETYRDPLDTHVLFGTLDAEFENERGKLLHARIEPVNVEDIAEYDDLRHEVSMRE